MDKSMLIGTVLGAVGVTAGGAIAGYHMLNKGPEYAEVLNVRPVTQTIHTPRQECHDEVVTHAVPPKDQHRILGTVAGAVLGGVVGSQFGGGNANKAFTAAGVVGGGYAGNKVQQRMQRGNTYQTHQQRCTTITDSKQELIGYDVSYRLGEKTDKVRMDHDPGPRIPVQDGQLVLGNAEPEPAPPVRR